MQKDRMMTRISARDLAAGMIFLLAFFFSTADHRVSGAASGGGGEKIIVFVSILPQAYFAERIGGERVDVHVMVGPGQSPATYEPLPKQMTALSEADLYFRIGVPFETVWMDRIRAAGEKIKIADTREGIPLMPMKAHHHNGHDHAGHDHGGLKNPHIWLSPRLVKIQAAAMCDALAARDPVNETFYRGRLQSFIEDLERLDVEIAGMLDRLGTRKFLVFHPAWSYFAADYGLEEIPIEVEGKEPGPKDLARLIEKAEALGIRAVFVQAQFGGRNAETVARAIGGEVVTLDPLAKDYLNNMRRTAETFARVMR
jgi:zinc transport system substrate-binding protein